MNTEPAPIINEEESETLKTFKTLDTFETIETPEAESPPVAQGSVRELLDNEKSDGVAMEGLILVNILEEIVRMEAPKIMEGFHMCCCERCLCDVMALSLNSIPAKYVVTKKGALFAKIASYGNQYKTDILSSLTQACAAVKKLPSHK